MSREPGMTEMQRTADLSHATYVGDDGKGPGGVAA